MNNYDEPYRQMLASFRTIDLQNLLGKFGYSKAGREFELKNRALDLLRCRPATFSIKEYLSKISEIYCDIHFNAPNPTSIQNTVPQANTIMTMRLQDNPQRYTPSPQCSQSSMQIARAGLPQVMPQVPRGISTNNKSPRGSRKIISQVPTNSPVNIVPKDPKRSNMALHHVNPNNAITTQPPPPPSLGNITFKKSPFFEKVEEVIKPTTLIGQEQCSIQNQIKGMRETSFSFIMNAEHATLIAMNRDVSNPEKVEHTYIMQIRICSLEQEATQLTDFFPIGLVIRIGNKPWKLPPYGPKRVPGIEPRRIATPIDITEGLKLNPFLPNSIIINWIPDGKNYIFGVSLVKILSTEILLNKLKKKKAKCSTETKNYITKKLADEDPDLATTCYRVSLLCPLSKMRMKMPAKSINCDHLQCFDAGTYILMNEKKETWVCPLCNKPCGYDDIQIQNYFLGIVTSRKLSANDNEIQILANGRWRVCEDLNNTETSIISAVKTTPTGTINLDDSDEEMLDVKKELKSHPTPESSEVSENLKTSFVDLTISDDDEEPSRENVQ